MRAAIGASGASNLLAIIVAALGYFVDVFDIWLYASVRVDSLKGLGLNDQQVKQVGEMLLNWQMGGFILGAIMFGIIADRRGRLTVLFSSILIYSLANIANGFATSVEFYALCRFTAGVGLAGELGAGIALVSELVSTKNRGWATTFVATIGVLGSIAAPQVVKAVGHWQTSYFIGGGMGILLLLMRIGVFESGMYDALKKRDDVKRGDFRHLLQTRDRRTRYLAIIMTGAPVWLFAGVMMTFSPEVQRALNIANPHALPDILFIGALGLCIGDLVFGAMSQWLRSRRIAFFVAYAWMGIVLALLLTIAKDRDTFYWLMFIGGLGAGYWAVFVTTSGEVFGTNLRGTVATTAPSFVRGMVIPINLVKNALLPSLGAIGSMAAVSAVILGLAFWGAWAIPETFRKDMDYLEH